VGGSEEGISAIALPIQGGGPVLGSLNLIFFSSSMTPAVAAERYLASMKEAVKEIESRWSAANKVRRKVA
jgi:IclR family mhp operon transcriptional activator